MRVDVFAERFDVSVLDVLTACHLLGFDAHDSDSEIDEVAFTAAVRHIEHEREIAASFVAPVRAPARARQPVLLGAAAAVLLTVAVGSFVLRGDGGSDRQPELQAAAAYKAQLRSSYDAAVGDSPITPDYQALASELRQITPPAALRREHAQLIAQAQTLVALTTKPPECADAHSLARPAADPASCPDANTAATELSGHVEDVLEALPK